MLARSLQSETAAVAVPVAPAAIRSRSLQRSDVWCRSQIRIREFSRAGAGHTLARAVAWKAELLSSPLTLLVLLVVLVAQ